MEALDDMLCRFGKSCFWHDLVSQLPGVRDSDDVLYGSLNVFHFLTQDTENTWARQCLDLLSQHTKSTDRDE